MQLIGAEPYVSVNTGLGTIDANNLVNDWNKVTLLSTATTMTASQTSFAHGTAITIGGAVTGTGTPTGNVALETDSPEPVNQGQTVFPLTRIVPSLAFLVVETTILFTP